MIGFSKILRKCSMKSLPYSPLPLGEGLGVRACRSRSIGILFIPLSRFGRGVRGEGAKHEGYSQRRENKI
jgi:hypothetical protein